MLSERRVAACVSLLLGLVPVLWSLLPEAFDTALPLTAAVVVSALLSLVPRPKAVAVLGWCAGAFVLTAATLKHAPMVGLGFIGLLPLGAMLLTGRTFVGVLALGAGLAMALVPELGGDPQRLGWASRSQADMLGWLWLGDWAIWHATFGLSIWEHREWIRRRQETLPALEQGIARDLQALHAVTSVVADPTLAGPVGGHGLTSDGLGLAARIDDRMVLLGYLEGPPLATLSVGWGLTAAARAGARTPAMLFRIAREQFEEILPTQKIRWLAVWDRRTGKVVCAPHGGTRSTKRCIVTTNALAIMGSAPYDDGRMAIEAIVPGRDVDLPLDGRLPSKMTLVALLGWCAIVTATAIGQSLALFIATYGILFVLHEQLSRWTKLHASWRDAATACVQERSADHDELRFAIARYHGTLLPYCIEADGVRATAHRLQGEVLDGTFADMVLTTRGRLRVLAGEVPGRGIASRFLGLATQMLARVFIERKDGDLSQLDRDVGAQLRPFATALRLPPKVRLGLVEVGSAGTCRGAGTLRTLVEVAVTGPASDAASLLAPQDRAGLTEQSRIDPKTSVYVTPAPAVPGPEDEAPALGRRQAALRTVEVLQHGDFMPGRDSLPTLFSTIFNGRDAPACGTLIELSSTRAGIG